MKTRMTGVLVWGLLASPGFAWGVQPALSSPAVEESEGSADLMGDRAAVRTELVAEMMELARYCKKKKLFSTRAQLYELVVRFEPDNRDAKKGLGFSKQKDGTWKHKPRRVPPKDKSKKLALEVAGKRDAAIKEYVEHLLAVLDSYGEKVSEADREQLLGDVLDVDPDNAHVHELRGEQKQGDLWVLGQTVVAKQHRAVLKDFVRTAFATMPTTEEVAPNAREAALGLPWSTVIASSVVRSVGTGTKEEIEKLSQAMWVTRSYFNAAFRARANLPKELTVYSFAIPEQGKLFIDKHPDLDDKYRTFLKTLEGSGIQGTDDFAQWAPNAQRRLDGVVRQAIAWLFADGYKIFPKHGWAFEGFGLYLTREVAGTRLTWFVGPSGSMPAKEEQALRMRLLDTRSNWMNEAHEILKKPTRPDLEALLGKGVNDLTPEDLLYSYVLAAYLLEAESSRLPAIFRDMGENKPSATVLAQQLGISISALDGRVRRWLAERLTR